MGKKRISAIDLSAKEVKTKTTPGKQHGRPAGRRGRITDMGEIMLQEAEEIKKKAKPLSAEAPVGVGKKAEETAKAPAKAAAKTTQKKAADKSASRPAGRRTHLRSKRYQALRKLVDPQKTYPLAEAVDLLKKMANTKVEETVELHLVVREPGKMTEKKAPLAHLKIGKVKEDSQKLLAKIEKAMKPFDLPQIQKAVLTSTMGPAIKLEIAP